MKSIYKEFEEVVREKGKKLGIEVCSLRGEKSVWEIKNWLITLDEAEPLTEASRIVLVIDKKKTGLIAYYSPYAEKAGIRQIFGINDSDISSEKRLQEILEEIKQSQ